ncbi:unnamed protein product [Ilex paraguariensis]|uniref:BRCT domain-containing protein n=1 Tax=Ilex paraguariensis TaxID=185542 RepID=A0ABC8SYU8_9AQUA
MAPHSQNKDPEVTLSQNMSCTFSDDPVFTKEGESEVPAMPPKSDINVDDCVADDSQTEDNELYLSDCRILLVGFDASEMRKLVNMVRSGGGSRYMSLNEKLTHIVAGTPSETEKKDVRGLGALGVIHVVRTTWLEDCDREKKEIPVLQRHIAYDLLFPKDAMRSNKGAGMGMAVMTQGNSSTVHSMLSDDQLRDNITFGSGMLLEKSREPQITMNRDCSLRETGRCASANQNQFCASMSEQKIGKGSSNEIQNRKSLTLFKGRLFRFSSSFPKDRRDEIVQWVNQGGGEVVDDHIDKNVHFIVECHGVVPSLTDVTGSTSVSSHWIRSCLEDGCLLDVCSHILYTPLPCQIPLPGFESFRFCVSQYDEKDRLLLRNLCFVLGAKFVEKLTKKVTHLLCKFASGPKYEAACKWGIQLATSEWIYECVMQNEVVALGSFWPKESTSQDREGGLCTISQYPTQAVRMISAANVSQFPSQSQDSKDVRSQAIGSRRESLGDEANCSSIFNKRARFWGDDCTKGSLSSRVNQTDPICGMNSTENNRTENDRVVSHAVPDVAAAIEDLLEETSKIQDLKSPQRTGCDKSLFSSDCPMLGQDHVDPHGAFAVANHWFNRTNQKEDICNLSGDGNAGIYDGFSETQTESQVVGYEEDLSGRQMIIDRVRTRSSVA